MLLFVEGCKLDDSSVNYLIKETVLVLSVMPKISKGRVEHLILCSLVNFVKTWREKTVLISQKVVYPPWLCLLPILLELTLEYFTTLLYKRLTNGNLNWLLFFSTNLMVLFTDLVFDILELMSDTS